MRDMLEFRVNAHVRTFAEVALTLKSMTKCRVEALTKSRKTNMNLKKPDQIRVRMKAQ